MRCYIKVKQGENKQSVYEVFVSEFGADQVILDADTAPKNSGSQYSALKSELAQSKEPLMIDDLFSLGKNAREVAKELAWFKSNGIEIYVYNLPSTMTENMSRTALLYDVNAQYARRESDNIKSGQAAAAQNNKKIGRPRVPYPKDWDTFYAKWEQNEISSADFMKAVGLSQGTFYNFLREYKAEKTEQKKNDSNVNESENIS